MTKSTQHCVSYLQEKANEALQGWYGHLPENCEMRVLAWKVLGRTVEYFADENYSAFEFRNFEEVLRATRNFLEDLRGELNPLNGSLRHPTAGTYLYEKPFYESRLADHEKAENPEGWLSFVDRHVGSELALLALLEKQEESPMYWPIEDLSYTCHRYLSSPWLHCVRIDGLLVRTMLYQSVVDLGRTLTNASLNRYTEAFRRRERKANTLAVLLIVASVLVGLGAVSRQGWSVGLIIAFCSHMLLVHYDQLVNTELRMEKGRIGARLTQVQKIFLQARNKELSVVLLRERLTTIDGGKGEVLPDEIFSILDSAIRRDVVLWGIEAPNRRDC